VKGIIDPHVEGVPKTAPVSDNLFRYNISIVVSRQHIFVSYYIMTPQNSRLYCDFIRTSISLSSATYSPRSLGSAKAHYRGHELITDLHCKQGGCSPHPYCIIKINFNVSSNLDLPFFYFLAQ